MKKFILSIAAVAAMFASCSQDADLEIVDNGAKPKVITSINASSENGSRAVVDGTSIKWQAGDKLSVLGTNASSQAKNTAFTLSSGEGNTTGKFTNASSDITAISATMYPYQEGASWDATNSKLTLEIPSLQTGVKGSFDPKAAIMYAIGSSTDQPLKLAVNFLKVTVSEANVHSVTVSSSTTVLSGKIEVTGSGVTAASEGSLKSVTLTAGKGNCFEAGDYYIAVKAGDIVSPYVSYVYYNNDHTATEKTKAGTSTLAFDGKNVRGISANFSSGTVTTRTAVQLWANGPYFAEYNVGASSATDGGTKMTFANAIKIGGDYVWGSWCTPSKGDMDELVLAAQGKSSKVSCGYMKNGSTYGFNFTGKGDYSAKSVFFPDPSGEDWASLVDYWSSTPAGGGNVNSMSLLYTESFGVEWTGWSPSSQGQDYYVRPVLK